MDANTALRQLRSSSSLSIIRLAEPILSTRIYEDDHAGNRTSNASSAVSDVSKDPTVLQADLQHYRDLFAKLRFSYVEQVTKEKFLRTITQDAPAFITAEDNAILDEKNKEQKALLKEKKEDLVGMLQDLEAQGRQLAQRYEQIELSTTQLEMLPIELEELDKRIASLEAAKEPQSDDPDLRLPLSETVVLLAEREQSEALLDTQIQELQMALTQNQVEILAMEEELEPLQMRKESALTMLKELENQETMGESELQGRWLVNTESALRMMLEV